jgi:predicted RNA-binding Zn-ribbon protein involved in translation (DUF1610 family)
MQKCPKCSSQYGDDVKTCQTCGAILEPIFTKQPSWRCSQCGQSVPSDFEVCWNCGTSQDGVPDSAFSKEPASDDDRPRAWQPSGPAATTKPMIHPCPKCGSSKIIPHARILVQGTYSDGRLRVVVDGDPNALIFKDCLYDQLTASICGDCGHVELTVSHPSELYEHYRQSKEFGTK